MPDGIAARLAAIRERIAVAARRAGRDPEAIRLVAVSKGQSPERIREALLAGQRDFGENYQQELTSKATALASFAPAPLWRFQGALQRRKIKEILKVTTSILSVARIEELEEIEKRAGQAIEGLDHGGAGFSLRHRNINGAHRLKPVSPSQRAECFIEVNIALEPQKNGILPADLAALLDRASQLRNLEIRGLMCVPPFEGDPRPWFAATRELAARHGLRELSMGMSDDFEAAIEEGATMVRVGAAIFGARS